MQSAEAVADSAWMYGWMNRETTTIAALWLMAAVAVIGCEGAPLAGDDASAADTTVIGDSGPNPGDSVSTKPLSAVGGSDKTGNGWIDWSGTKVTPEILKGPQGGQHIWVSARTRNLHPKKARISVTMFVEGPAGKVCAEDYDCQSGQCVQVLEGKVCADVVVKPGTVEMTGTLKWENDYLVYTGLPAFVKEPCKIMDKKVRVELSVDDLYGVHADDKAWITPIWTGFCQ